MKARLFAFLAKSSISPLRLGDETISVETARALLRELIPATIEVRDVCTASLAVVAAAPHVSFDNWSEYFCNRVARRLGLGRVIAQNFRDHDPHSIPVSIGRFLHVNRPTESKGPGRRERETERALAAFEEYTAALARASGRERLPLDLLIEFHSHRRSARIEIATTGVSNALASHLCERYAKRRTRTDCLPPLRVEPLHRLTLAARAAKQVGSLQVSVTRCALHIEIPSEGRHSEEARTACSDALVELVNETIQRVNSTSESE